MAPSQSSSFRFAQTSERVLETVGSRSSQSCAATQCASGSPSPSASRGACTQAREASTHRSIEHASPSSHVTTAPPRHPSATTQTSRPLQ